MADASLELSESSVKDDVGMNEIESNSVPTRAEILAGSSSHESISPDAEPTEDGHINQLSKVMFEKIADYLQGELSGTIDDYKLFEEMNKVTTTKYSDMKQITANVNKALKDLNEKYKSLQPYLEQIEQIEESALKLEQAAYKLDAYSKRLDLREDRYR